MDSTREVFDFRNTGAIGIDTKSRYIFIPIVSNLVIYLLYSCHIPTLFLSYTYFILAIYLLYSCHKPTLFLSYTYSILVISQLYSCYIPTLFSS